MGLGVIGAAHGVYRICNHVLLLRLPLSDSSAKHWHAEREPACDVHAQSLEPPAVSLAAVLTTCADRRGGCRTCWLAPRSSLAYIQPRECPPSLTSVCPVIHSSTSPITHSTRLAISCGRRCWPPTNPKPHPTSQRRWQHSIVTWYRACHRVHLLPPAGRPGFPLAGKRAWGLAVMTREGWRGIVGVEVDSSACPPGHGGNDRDGAGHRLVPACLVAAGIMLLALVITIVAIRVRRAEPPAPPTEHKAEQADSKEQAVADTWRQP